MPSHSKVSPEHISIAWYNKELESSEKEIEEGGYYTQEQVRKRASQWGKKNVVTYHL